MATISEDFKVTAAEGRKALPVGTKRFTQKTSGAEAYLLEGTDAENVSGEEICQGVPYILDSSIQYYIRSPHATSIFGIVVEV